MEPPDRALELGSVLLGGSWRADDRKGLYAVPPVEPSVRSPLEPVYHVVAYAVVVPAVEHDLGLAVGLVVPVGVGNEEQVGGAGRPHAPEAHRQASQPLQVVVKDCFLIGPTVPIGVFQDDDAVPQPEVEVRPGLGIGIAFGHPEAISVVKGHGYGLADHGLAGKALHPEAAGQPHALDRLFRGGQGEVGLLGVGRLWEICVGGGLPEDGASKDEEDCFGVHHENGNPIQVPPFG